MKRASLAIAHHRSNRCMRGLQCIKPRCVRRRAKNSHRYPACHPPQESHINSLFGDQYDLF
jgi:hypothetical protein